MEAFQKNSIKFSIEVNQKAEEHKARILSHRFPVICASHRERVFIREKYRTHLVSQKAKTLEISEPILASIQKKNQQQAITSK